jgi:hypothetical protein
LFVEHLVAGEHDMDDTSPVGQPKSIPNLFQLLNGILATDYIFSPVSLPYELFNHMLAILVPLAYSYYSDGLEAR